jgi:hypothetical protein
MGGIITRAFLLKYRGVVPKIRFLYFFATPTNGSPYARLGNLISRNQQLRELFPMQPQSDGYLDPLERNWLAAAFELKSYCGYETKKLFGIAVVVDQASALALCNRRGDPIDADHDTIVKPKDQRSDPYLSFEAAFEETVPTAHEASKSSTAVNSPQNMDLRGSCNVVAAENSEIVSHVHFRQKILPPGLLGADSSPYLQELFYDWTLSIHPERTIVGIVVIVSDAFVLHDRVRVAPDLGTVSEAIPKWTSGFNEPRSPDYYARIVSIPVVHKGDDVVITFRRPLKPDGHEFRFHASDFMGRLF